MGRSLDDILNDEEVTPEVETAPEVDDGPPRDEHGRFAAKSTGESEEPEAPEPDSGPPPQEQEAGHVPFAALKDERTKRQEFERKALEAEARLAQYEQMVAQQQVPQQQDVDPEMQAFVDYVREQVRNQVMNDVQQQMSSQGLMLRGQVAEMQARARYQDYDATVEHFKAATEQNPFLLQQLYQAEDPAEYAYRAGKQIVEARTLGTAPSPDQMRAELEAKIREELKAELGLPRPQAPTTLASERSVGSRSGPAWSGPASLNDLLS